MIKNKINGTYEFPVEEGTKTLHFGMNFIINLQDFTGQDLVSWGKEVEERKDDPVYQYSVLCDIVFCSMIADNQLKDIEVDYNIFQVREWVLAAQTNNPKVLEEVSEIMMSTLNTISGKN